MDGERRLDQPGHAGRGLGVADVGLDGTKSGFDGTKSRDVGGRRRLAPRRRQRCQLRRVAHGGAGAVPFEVAHRLDAEAGPLVRPGQGHLLPLGLGPADAAMAVGGDPPAADDGVAAAAQPRRVVLAHQHHEAAPLAGEETRGARVEHPHLARGQGAHAGEAHQLERVEREVHAARQGHVEVARGQGRAGVGHGQQRGGAGAVQRVAAAVEVEVVADAARDGVGEAARERLLHRHGEGRLVRRLHTAEEAVDPLRFPSFFRERGGEHPAHERPAQPQGVGAGELARQGVAEEHAGGVSRQPLGVGEAGVGERLGRHFQGQPVGEVGGPVGAAGHLEAHAVELPPFEQGRLGQVEAVRIVGIVGIVGKPRQIIGEVQPLRRHPPEGPPAGEHVLPQLARRAGIGVAARHADDGNAPVPRGHHQASAATETSSPGSWLLRGARLSAFWAASAWR